MNACSGDFHDSYTYSPNSSPAHVIQNLAVSYKRREAGTYASLLADDFRFHFDALTLAIDPGLPAFLTRFEDSTLTHGLLNSSSIADIRIDLQHAGPVPVNEPGRESWRRLDVPDTFLEVEQIPDPGQPEGIILRVDGQLQQFYCRKGRNPADTLAASPTSCRYYLVEWRDFGMGVGKTGGAGLNREAAVLPTTWGAIKVFFLKK